METWTKTCGPWWFNFDHTRFAVSYLETIPGCRHACGAGVVDRLEVNVERQPELLVFLSAWLESAQTLPCLVTWNPKPGLS